MSLMHSKTLTITDRHEKRCMRVTQKVPVRTWTDKLKATQAMLPTMRLSKTVTTGVGDDEGLSDADLECDSEVGRDGTLEVGWEEWGSDSEVDVGLEEAGDEKGTSTTTVLLSPPRETGDAVLDESCTE